MTDKQIILTESNLSGVCVSLQTLKDKTISIYGKPNRVIKYIFTFSDRDTDKFVGIRMAYDLGFGEIYIGAKIEKIGDRVVRVNQTSPYAGRENIDESFTLELLDGDNGEQNPFFNAFKYGFNSKIQLQEEWYKDAKIQTLETLSDFCNKLANSTYGSILQAATAAAIAAANAIDRSTGGMTGAQGKSVALEFVKRWNGLQEPFEITKFGDLLYPQFENRFTSIPESVWEWLQEEAKKILNSENCRTKAIEEHLQSIIDGVVPFGLKVINDFDQEIIPGKVLSKNYKFDKSSDSTRISQAFDQKIEVILTEEEKSLVLKMREIYSSSKSKTWEDLIAARRSENEENIR
jgi:hypothetical protein